MYFVHKGKEIINLAIMEPGFLDFSIKGFILSPVVRSRVRKYMRTACLTLSFLSSLEKQFVYCDYL